MGLWGCSTATGAHGIWQLSTGLKYTYRGFSVGVKPKIARVRLISRNTLILGGWRCGF